MKVTYRQTPADYTRGLWVVGWRRLAMLVAVMVGGLTVVWGLALLLGEDARAILVVAAVLPLLVLLLPLAAAWRLRALPRRNPRQYPPDPWTLEVAPDGLHVSVGETRFEVRWDHVRWVRLSRRDVLVRTRTGLVQVPRREVDGPALHAAIEEARAAGAVPEAPAEPPEPREGEASFELTLADHVAWRRWLDRQGRGRAPILVLRGVLGGVLLALGALVLAGEGVALALGRGGDPLLAPLGLLMALMGALLLSRLVFRVPLVRRQVRRAVRRGISWTGPVRVAWGPWGIWTDGRGPLRLAWGHLTEVVETRDHVFLRLGPQLAVVVRRDALGPDAGAIVERWRLRVRDAVDAVDPVEPVDAADPFAPPR